MGDRRDVFRLQPLMFQQPVEHALGRQAPHADEPIDHAAVAVDGELAVRRLRDLRQPAIDVAGEAAVQLHFGAAVREPSRERTQIDELVDDRLLELVRLGRRRGRPRTGASRAALTGGHPGYAAGWRRKSTTSPMPTAPAVVPAVVPTFAPVVVPVVEPTFIALAAIDMRQLSRASPPLGRLEKGDDFAIFELVKVRVEGAEAGKPLRLHQAHDLIDRRLELAHRLGRRHGGGDDHAARAAPRQRACRDQDRAPVATLSSTRMASRPAGLVASRPAR